MQTQISNPKSKQQVEIGTSGKAVPANHPAGHFKHWKRFSQAFTGVPLIYL